MTDRKANDGFQDVQRQFNSRAAHYLGAKQVFGEGESLDAMVELASLGHYGHRIRGRVGSLRVNLLFERLPSGETRVTGHGAWLRIRQHEGAMTATGLIDHEPARLTVSPRSITGQLAGRAPGLRSRDGVHYEDSNVFAEISAIDIPPALYQWGRPKALAILALLISEAPRRHRQQY